MKLSVIIATYQREDNKTSFYLKRALDSVFNQIHQDFKVYLIGDKYENNEEFNQICRSYNQEKIYSENLPIAKERDLYPKGMIRWSYGGVNAMNYAIEKSLSDGNNYICHLDHDDVWSPNHLQVINDCIVKNNADWVCTKSTYNVNNYLPKIIGEPNECIKFLPSMGALIHSSVCMNFKTIPLRYRNLYAETGFLGVPADAELWERTKLFITENNLKSYFINVLTCAHDNEGFERM